MARVYFESEEQVAKMAAAELVAQGFEVYQEVSTGYGGQRADLVGVRDRVVAIVETKTSLSLKLLDQAIRWVGYAHYVIVAVPFTRLGEAAHRFLKHEGIGLWLVGSEQVDERVSPRLVRRIVNERFLIGALSPEQKTGEYGNAGTRGGGYWTPFQRTCRNLRGYVQQNPGIELRDALGKMEHHYASDKSAKSALPKLIRSGAVRGIRLDDSTGRLKLYPITEVGEVA